MLKPEFHHHEHRDISIIQNIILLSFSIEFYDLVSRANRAYCIADSKPPFVTTFLITRSISAS